MHIQNLFPLPVSFSSLGRDLTSSELNFILNQKTARNEGNSVSLNHSLLNTEELSDINNFVKENLNIYFKNVCVPDDQISLYITQSWANYTKPGEFHHRHTHSNSYISGVFYPQADRSVDKIYFFKTGYERLKIKSTGWNQWNSESWWFEVGAGDLILFPSHLEHMVETKVGNGLRVSISFNTFLKGHLGFDETLTGLYLGET